MTQTSIRALQILKTFSSLEIASDALSSPLAQRVLALAGKEIPVQIISDDLQPKFAPVTAREFANGKKKLVLRKHKGQFFKRCPGSSQKSAITCCNYYVLNLGSQCNFDCTYCYLQSYLKVPQVQLFTNIEDAIEELEVMASSFPNLPFRVGTGELTDSLSLDPISLYSRKLLEFFQRFPKWTLEFKTKSDEVDAFLDLGPSPNVVVSWSINPEIIIESEEHGTARLQQRIVAAKKCVTSGFKIAFHLDPMIAVPNWRMHYSELIQRLCSEFRPEDISVISVGSLRMQPEQRHTLRQRHGQQTLLKTAELFPSESGKLRYDQSLRAELAKFAVDSFRRHSPKWPVFLCMESPETWLNSLQSHPMQQPQLRELFRPLPSSPKTEKLDAQSQQESALAESLNSGVR